MENVAHTIITKGLKVEEGVLIGLRGTSTGREYVLIGNDLSLGRSGECDIVLTDVNASRQHARIQHFQDQYLLLDAASKNGTYVNEQRVDQCTLRDGDCIQIGEAVFKFKLGRPNSTRTRS